MEQQAYRQQRFSYKNLRWEWVLLVVLMISTLLIGCGESAPPPIDICSDRSWDECIHIAESECGLYSDATEFELQQCEPYVRCENTSFDDCIEEQQR
jgi:hypothetical protein